MKKVILAVLVLLLVAGCNNRKEPELQDDFVKMQVGAKEVVLEKKKENCLLKHLIMYGLRQFPAS